MSTKCQQFFVNYVANIWLNKCDTEYYKNWSYAWYVNKYGYNKTYSSACIWQYFMGHGAESRCSSFKITKPIQGFIWAYMVHASIFQLQGIMHINVLLNLWNPNVCMFAKYLNKNNFFIW